MYIGSWMDKYECIKGCWSRPIRTIRENIKSEDYLYRECLCGAKFTKQEFEDNWRGINERQITT